MDLKKILLVEDEPAIAALLQDVLEEAGYQVDLAANGREGLHRLLVVRPDMVLSDVMMPVLDGRELCHAINSNPHYQAIPVVLMSASREDQCCQDCNCAAFLPKPFVLDQVVATIAQVLKQDRRAAYR
ncbi:MAG: response regulator [Chloroflexota bacterium]|nr:response regulator [Chloroflexota bacterium]